MYYCLQRVTICVIKNLYVNRLRFVNGKSVYGRGYVVCTKEVLEFQTKSSYASKKFRRCVDVWIP